MDKTLKYLPLGGVTGVTKNLHVYEYENQVLIVDCGIGFADETMIGIDLMLPDITYLKNKKIIGMAITHGHEDHFGALPYLINELPGKFDIFATPLTSAFINEKFKQFNINKKAVTVNFDKDILLGNFLLSFVRVTHSVPDSSNIFIKTPVGNIFHASDFKFDLTPYDNKKTDFAKIVRLSDEGIMCLMSDSLGSEREGFTTSEKEVSEKIYKEMRATKGKFLFTTYSSNIARLNQAIDAARTLNRKVCFVGRSLLKAKEVGINLGYIKFDKSQEIDLKDVKKYNNKQIVLLVAGSQGQENSALSRIVNGDHRDITLNANDSVVFSSDAIPGNEVAVNALIDDIARSGAKVIYSDITDGLHVSGHGSQGDLTLMQSLVRPKKVIPIGGTYKHMVAYKALSIKNGFLERDIILPDDGQEVIFSKNQVRLGAKIQLKNVYVDQVSGGEVETFVLRDRERISKEGVVIIMAEIDSYGNLVDRPNVVLRGFTQGEITEITDGLSNEIKNNLKTKKNKVGDWNYMRRTVGNIAERYLVKKLKKSPLVLPVVIEV